MLANAMVPTSAAELRRYAEMMPSGTPTHDREREREEAQLDGRGQALDDQLRDRQAVPDGRAQVPGRRSLQVAHELDGQRLVQAVTGRELGALLGRRALTEGARGRGRPGCTRASMNTRKMTAKRIGIDDQQASDDVLGHAAGSHAARSG